MGRSHKSEVQHRSISQTDSHQLSPLLSLKHYSKPLTQESNLASHWSSGYFILALCYQQLTNLKGVSDRSCSRWCLPSGDTCRFPGYEPDEPPLLHPWYTPDRTRRREAASRRVPAMREFPHASLALTNSATSPELGGRRGIEPR